jgi:RNA polymerase sigma factor (sigma-70 family)
VKKGMSSDIRNRPIITSTSELSFETVFTRYYSLVYQLAYRYVGQSDEADDIAQEVFLRYYRVPPKANSEAEQRAWLCRVATNLCLNVLRSRQRRTNREERAGETVQRIAPEAEAQLNPEQHALADEQAALVRSILSEMPERQQTYLVLRSTGLSYAEIAQATGVANASVGALLARAEREFRRRYHERVTTTGA